MPAPDNQRRREWRTTIESGPTEAYSPLDASVTGQMDGEQT